MLGCLLCAFDWWDCAFGWFVVGVDLIVLAGLFDCGVLVVRLLNFGLLGL